MGNKFHFFLLKFVENKKIHPVLCVCFFPLQLMGSTIYMGLLHHKIAEKACPR